MGNIMKSKIKTLRLLLVEDIKSDARLILEFLKRADFNSVLYTVNDGIEAMNFLYRHYDYDHCPDIMILDLNLPRMSGLKILKKIKNNHTLKRIPIIILSPSDAKEEVDECYKNYANCYLVKPHNLSDFEKVINSI